MTVTNAKKILGNSDSGSDSSKILTFQDSSFAISRIKNSVQNVDSVTNVYYLIMGLILREFIP